MSPQEAVAPNLLSLIEGLLPDCLLQLCSEAERFDDPFEGSPELLEQQREAIAAMRRQDRALTLSH